MKQIWTPRAWLNEGWAERVLLSVDAQGNWHAIEANTNPTPQAQVLEQALLPGLINAHSHAFQRSFAGRAERRLNADDDFWSWREQMYQVALGISPAQLKQVATTLYGELRQGGYSHVCEFHYLQHQSDGKPYEDELIMAWMLIEAAEAAGIGLTLLPVLYERDGFTAQGLRPEQRRFKTDPAWVLHAEQRINAAKRKNIHAGVAIHSLRAAHPENIKALVDKAQGPIHIHIAEQTGEVEECLQVTGMRPVEWLASHLELNERWSLIHATHVTEVEIDLVTKSKAHVVICPSTEANLGDGLTNMPAWLAAGARLAIGSDSHVCRDAFEELRLLEYGQRLLHRKRTICADSQKFAGSTAEYLFAQMHCPESAGLHTHGLAVGAKADAYGLDLASSLDEVVFSSPSPSASLEKLRF